MKIRTIIFFLIIFTLLTLGVSSCPFDKQVEDIIDEINKTEEEVIDYNYTGDTVSIFSWNLGIYGDSKSSNPTYLAYYKKIISDYDIVFVQEIRDIDGSAFKTLCGILDKEYECKISSRAGRSISKEQYGIFYKKGIDIIEFKDFNLEPNYPEQFERSPVKVEFDINGYPIIFYVNHLKPTDVKQELIYLEELIENENDFGNVVIVGDLNTACNYFDHSENPEIFEYYRWIIKGDTTVNTNTFCNYDNFLLNENVYLEHLSHGIRTQDITSELSDHYGIFLNLKTSP